VYRVDVDVAAAVDDDEVVLGNAASWAAQEAHEVNSAAVDVYWVPQTMVV